MVQCRQQIVQTVHTPDRDPRYHRSLHGIFSGHHHPSDTAFCRLLNNGKYTLHLLDLPIQAQFSQKQCILQRFLRYQFHIPQKSHSYRQIKGGTIFTSTCRSQIYCDMCRWDLETGIFHGHTHPLPGFLHLTPQRPHQLKRW